MPSRRQVLAAFAASATAGLAACSSGSKEPAANEQPLEKVTYLTGYGEVPREQYARVALGKGHFKEVGIDVDIKPGQPSDYNVKLLAGGQAQFASIDFVSAITNSTAYKDYRIIAAIQDKTLIAVVTLADNKITKPSDLVGKTLASGGEKAASRTIFPAYARLAQVDPNSIKWQVSTPDAIAGLLATGKVDAITQYLIDQPSTKVAAGGRELVGMPYSDYLTDLYGTVVVASTKIIQEKPDLVRNFATAIMKGTRYAVDNPEEAGKIMNQQVKTTDPKAAAEVMTMMKPYVKAGAVEEDRVMRGIALLESLQLVKPGLTPDKILATADVRPKA